MARMWLMALLLTTLGVPCSLAYSFHSSFAASAYQSMRSGPGGVIVGRQGYLDSTGRSRSLLYTVGRDGRVRVKDDPSGRALLSSMARRAMQRARFSLWSLPDVSDFSDFLDFQLDRF